MVTYVDMNGNTVELPVMTLDIVSRYEDATNCTAVRDKAVMMLDLMRDIIDEAYLTKRLGSLDLEKIDLVELCNLFEGTSAAYGEAMRAERDAANTASIDAAERVLDKVQKMADALEANKGANRQVFSPVA